MPHRHIKHITYFLGDTTPRAIFLPARVDALLDLLLTNKTCQMMERWGQPWLQWPWDCGVQDPERSKINSRIATLHFGRPDFIPSLRTCLAGFCGKLPCRTKRPRRTGWHSRTAPGRCREELQWEELSKCSDRLAGMHTELLIGLRHKPAREVKGNTKSYLRCLLSLRGFWRPSRQCCWNKEQHLNFSTVSRAKGCALPTPRFSPCHHPLSDSWEAAALWQGLLLLVCQQQQHAP